MVETIRQLLEDNRAQQETMIMAFVDFLKNWQPEVKTVAIPLENSLENDFPRVSNPQPEVKTVAVPSKMELALEWFRLHPDDVKRTGRDLSENVTPQGVQISHKYWNDAKKVSGGQHE